MKRMNRKLARIIKVLQLSSSQVDSLHHIAHDRSLPLEDRRWAAELWSVVAGSQLRYCRRDNHFLSVSLFGKHRGRKDGISRWCKQCNREKSGRMGPPTHKRDVAYGTTAV